MEADADPSTSICLDIGYLEELAYGFRVTSSWEFSQSFKRVWRMSAGGRPRNGLFLVQRQGLDDNEPARRVRSRRNPMPMKDTIAAIRKEAGITQEEMARRLYVTRQTVSRWENGWSA